jgi:hypothetical protein
MCVRTPIKVKRKAITVASDHGHNKGGWFAFPKPDEEPPSFGRLKASQRVLWCPYCNDWTVFDKNHSKYSDQHSCTGVCGWANTGDFYVKTVNKIWFEDVPLSELKKIDIPRPSKGRR